MSEIVVKRREGRVLDIVVNGVSVQLVHDPGDDPDTVLRVVREIILPGVSLGDLRRAYDSEIYVLRGFTECYLKKHVFRKKPEPIVERATCYVDIIHTWICETCLKQGRELKACLTKRYAKPPPKIE